MKPYRLLAVEANQVNSVLLIDLKPLRVQRIRIKIQPTQLAVTSWGYILADAQGQMILLDDYGQMVGQITAPSATDLAPDATTTAIAAVSSSEVLLATWSETCNQGRLYTLDLRSLDIDFLF
jgi:serine/threonine-protein kinase